MVELYEGSIERGADAGLPILGCKQKFPLWNRSALSKPEALQWLLDGGVKVGRVWLCRKCLALCLAKLPCPTPMPRGLCPWAGEMRLQ